MSQRVEISVSAGRWSCELRIYSDFAFFVLPGVRWRFFPDAKPARRVFRGPMKAFVFFRLHSHPDSRFCPSRSQASAGVGGGPASAAAPAAAAAAPDPPWPRRLLRRSVARTRFTLPQRSNSCSGLHFLGRRWSVQIDFFGFPVTRFSNMRSERNEHANGKCSALVAICFGICLCDKWAKSGKPNIECSCSEPIQHFIQCRSRLCLHRADASRLNCASAAPTLGQTLPWVLSPFEFRESFL